VGVTWRAMCTPGARVTRYDLVIHSSCPQDDKMAVSIQNTTLSDSIDMEDYSIDVDGELKMTVSKWEMTMSIWSS
jgi:hypothetical protein